MSMGSPIVPRTSASGKPMRSKCAWSWSPFTSIATPPIFFGSPNVSRPPTVACSVVIGMNSGYSPSTLPCRARTPNQPAPNIGVPVPMLTVAKRMRARGSLGSSGGGNTARITSRSVSHNTVTAVDQIFVLVASISRLRCCSGTRAPYRIAAIRLLPVCSLPGLDHLLVVERVARRVGGIVGWIEGDLHLGDRRTEAVADLAQCLQVERVHGRGVRLDHLLRLGRWARCERGAQRLGRVRITAFGVRVVGTPHDAIDADLVTHRTLRGAEEARADPEVALEVLARRQRHVFGGRTEERG